MDIALALDKLVPGAIYGGSLNPRNKFEPVPVTVERPVMEERPVEGGEEGQTEMVPTGETETVETGETALVDSGKAMTEKQLYDALRWEDERAKPSWAQVQAAWNDVKGDALWAETRIERDARLKASDWTQIPDAPLDDDTRQAWKDYRTALRNITEAFESPDAVQWPGEPQ